MALAERRTVVQTMGQQQRQRENIDAVARQCASASLTSRIVKQMQQTNKYKQTHTTNKQTNKVC